MYMQMIQESDDIKTCPGKSHFWPCLPFPSSFPAVSPVAWSLPFSSVFFLTSFNATPTPWKLCFHPNFPFFLLPLQTPFCGDLTGWFVPAWQELVTVSLPRVLSLEGRCSEKNASVMVRSEALRQDCVEGAFICGTVFRVKFLELQG